MQVNVRCLLRFLLVLFAVQLGAQPFRVEAQDRSDPWTGTWQTQWRGSGAILHLRQAGNTVTGSYPLFSGTVTGTAARRRLEGRWKEDSGRSGGFSFVLAPDGNTFMGRFDSGEWWTGARLSNSADYLVRPAVFSSPRETLRSFLNAANSARGGFIERIQPALDTIDFSKLRSEKLADSPLLPQEKIDYARNLYRALDALTFRLWGLPGPSLPGSTDQPSVVVTLAQAGTTNTFDLHFQRSGEKWLIDPPPRMELNAALKQLYARNGQRLPTDKDHLRLQNPRDTMRTFIEEMARFESGGRIHVFRTLDLESVDRTAKDEAATLIALYLQHVLDHIGYVYFQEIPNDPDQREPYVHFRHGAGNIVIAPFSTPAGQTEWRFTADTLHSLRSLYAAIEDMPQEPGMLTKLQPSVYFVIREFLRGRAPGLLRALGPIEIWQWLALLLFLLTSVALALVLTALIVWFLRRRPAWAATFAAGRMQWAVAWPLRFTFIGLLWYLKLGAWGFPEVVMDPCRRLAGTLGFGSAVWLAFQAVGLAADFSCRAIGTTGHKAVLTSLSFGVLRILIVVAGVLLLAEVWSLPYTSVLAGLGIGGLAFALAAQPTLQNMIAGFTLYADSPLSVGDFCRYGDKVGTVEQIGLRSTRIRSLQRSLVSIPNSEFANLQLENLARRDRMLLQTTLQLRYETTPDQLRFVLAELRRLLVAHPRIHPDPARVRFSGFGAHSLDLEVFAYALTADYNEFLAIREDVLFRMMQIVLQSGTGFAFPSQVNYLARDTGLDADLTRQAEAAVAAWREQSRLPFPDLPAAEIRQLDGKLDYPPQGSPAQAPAAEHRT